MADDADLYYWLPSGVDVVPVNNNRVECRSDTLTVRIDGPFARLFAEKVATLLDGRHAFRDIAERLTSVNAAELARHLEALADAQVLRRDRRPKPARSARIGEHVPHSFLALLEAMGIAHAGTALGSLRVAVVGLEGPGAYTALALARAGIGRLKLVDPFECTRQDLALLPLVGSTAQGRPRAEVLRDALLFEGYRAEMPPSEASDVTRDDINRLVRDCQMVVSTFDRGFGSIHHWVNQATLEHGVPAIYAECGGCTARVGPLVLPRLTSCYMCFRMRSLACVEDFEGAMAHEKFLDRQKRAMLAERSTFPTLAPYVGSLLANEVLKQLLSIGPPTLAGRIHVFDAITLVSEVNDVLRRPDCPVCRKKAPDGSSLTKSQLVGAEQAPGDLLALAKKLVGRHTGIISNVQVLQKDPTEPHKPYVFLAQMSNHRFMPKGATELWNCSGKGFREADARRGALGEAVERYAGSLWDPYDVHYGRRQDLLLALDPRELVLYAPEQYGALPYARYSDDSVLGWVTAQSLVDHREWFIPAVGTLMLYEPRIPEEYICPVTSSGLAAGQTLAQATLRAALEVIERDAFMITWLNRLRCQGVDARSHPDRQVVEMCLAYGRRRVDIRLFRVPTDQPCYVYAAIGLRAGEYDGPAAIVGVGADMAPGPAARRAILEVGQGWPGLRLLLHSEGQKRRLAELVADPTLVATPDDHGLLYASPTATQWLDFLLDRPCESCEWDDGFPESVDEQLQRLIDHLHSTGADLLRRDMTPPDLAPLGLHIARVIIPGFQPIDFGLAERRLGGKRLYEVPHALGLTAAPTRRENLNPAPHPLP